VLERVAAGSYTYHRLQLASGSVHWVVTLGRGHPAGTLVRIRSFGAAARFRSARLARTFEQLIFATLTPRS
jgi:hypothetical protein